ncbi:MAG: ArsA family ATPase [Candidatus Thermoplasmatota archaeon]
MAAHARLSIILGKGGVGRTTIACAFAVDRAVAGERVLLVSIVMDEDPTARIQHEAAGVDTGGRLQLLSIDTRDLVDDIVRRVTRMGTMADFIIRSPSYESLVDIVPGVHEMALFHELEKRTRGEFDRIVLDAPATGHGLHFLAAPEKTSRILAGPLKDRAERLRSWLQDPATTDVVIVTLAEEMPVRETIELASTLRRQGFPLDNIVVNRWLPRVFVDEGPHAVLDAVSKHRLADPSWVTAMRLVSAQHSEAESHLAELRALDAKLAIVPLIPDSSHRLLKVAEAMKDFVPNGGSGDLAPRSRRPEDGSGGAEPRREGL